MKKIIQLLSQNSFLFLAIIFFLVFNFNYLFGGTLLKGDDASSFYYPVTYYLKQNLEQGIFPFYTEKMFSGYPIYQNAEAGYLNPLRIFLTLILPFERVLPVEYLIFFLIGLVGYFKFLREKKISEAAIFFSHFIFFYNLQFIGRFVHQQLIFSVLLLPMLIYLTDKFFSETNQRKKKINLCLSSILVAIGLLYGSYPGIFLLLLGQFIYALTNLIKKNIIKKFSVFYLMFIGLFLSFSFYSLYPTYSLFKDSARNIEEFSVTKGSISPVLMIANFITPTPLGTYNEYLGEKFNSSWFWHEVHTYQGLSFLIISILGFIYLKNVEFKRFFIVTFSLFIILATLKYTFFANIFDFPPFNLFRYHLRFGMIFSFALSILGASVIHKLFHEYDREDFKNMIKNFVMLLLPTLLLIYTFQASYNFYESKTLVTHLKNAIIANTIPNFRTSLITPVFLIVLIFIYKFTHRKSLLVVLPIIAIFEFMIFVNGIYTETLVFKNLINPQVKKITDFYPGKRVAFDNKIYGNQTLYYSNWNIYGYAVLDQKNYKDFMENNGLNSRRYKEKNYFLLDKLKVYRVIDENYNIHGVTDGRLIEGDLSYENVSLNENHKIFKVESENEKVVSTYIKFDKNIELLINGKKVEYPVVRDIFYELNLTKGTNVIEFIYQPRELYLGFILGLMLSIFSLIILKRIEFK